MKLSRPEADVFVPEPVPGLSVAAALARTTHLCVLAHQDDIEINAYPAIAECFGRPGRCLTGVVMTNGAGSARTGPFAGTTDEEMQAIRRDEQRAAARLGRYNLQLQLAHPSADVKRPDHPGVRADLTALFAGCRPEVVYLHQPMDRHDTHVACFLRCVEAIRSLPAGQRPRRVLGVEGWRDLDWMTETDKVALDASLYPELAEGLINVFASQIAGGKRYDKAALGRRAANATLQASHAVDEATAVSLAVDLTPLIRDDSLCPVAFAEAHLERFRGDVTARLRRLGA